MDVIKYDGSAEIGIEKSIVSIGNYDGVHVGHQYLLHELILKSGQCGCESVVVTFEPHPREFFSKKNSRNNAPFLLTSFKEKVNAISKFHIDKLIWFEFTEEFSKTTARVFVKNILVDKLKAAEVIVGFNFCFGHGREGCTESLKKMGAEYGFKVTIVEPKKLGDDVISSSYIRELITDGDIRRAGRLLGRQYALTGEVVQGKDVGKGIGFPTINLAITGHLIPKDGVYSVIVDIMGHRFKGVSNIGVQPTFGENPRSVEVHILDFDEEIYGKDVTVEFVDRLRNERKFDSVEELKDQINLDIKNAYASLSHEL